MGKKVIKTGLKLTVKRNCEIFWRVGWMKITIDEWLELIMQPNGTCTVYPGRGLWSAERALNSLRDAARTLTLERKLTEEESKNISNMLSSMDSENRYMAICILCKKKARKFSRTRIVERAVWK